MPQQGSPNTKRCRSQGVEPQGNPFDRPTTQACQQDVRASPGPCNDGAPITGAHRPRAPVSPHREERCHSLQAAVSGSVNSLGRVLFTVRSLYFSASGFVPVFQPCVRCTTLIQAALPSSSTRGYARSLLSNRVDAVTRANTGDQNERVDGGAAWLSQHRHEGLSPSVYSIPRLCHSRQPSTPHVHIATTTFRSWNPFSPSTRFPAVASPPLRSFQHR